MVRRVGIIGYGHLGQYLVQQINSRSDMELVFVWNRTVSALKESVQIRPDQILEDLSDFEKYQADLIVEVAHPNITQTYGPRILQKADFMIGSPTALADAELEAALRSAATDHGLYVPSGAFWGGDDVKKMADRGTLQALKVTMTKHPSSFKLNGQLKVKNDQVTDTKKVLYDGPVRELCPLAPNNVNTMAAAALAAHNLGFDKVQGCIVADPELRDWHIVEVDVWGPGDMSTGSAFHCKTVRSNPAQVGHVTGLATYASFLSSLLAAKGKGSGVHLC
ncbi:putative L-aspartate dehydrogenase isoform X1 [Haliotis rubra]|uniref:putative L-aspartate dehydrogenase isoform X1 n=1 Tax=Haliotis rubra TaxID=36100 RepID=UPI001EE5B60B|nr:putative L-aspartate dehydrogenase isoform X1 [Haliotis rubra]